MNGEGSGTVLTLATPLEGEWVIVGDGSREYVGQLAGTDYDSDNHDAHAPRVVRLKPAYEWDSATIMQEASNGARIPTGRDRWAFPIEFSRETAEVRIRPTKLIVVEGTLRGIVAECVKRAEALRRQLQAKDAIQQMTPASFGGGPRGD